MAILRGAPGAVPGGRPRIVLADEDPTTSALLKTVLQNYGMECREARDGGEAVELIRTFAPDAAILDVSMPNLDGLQVLSLLKSDPATSATRVIFLTARQQEADIVKAFALGAEDYITKPFNPMELVARLKRILRRET
jgi:DNA-binding response OmpR family regulator